MFKVGDFVKNNDAHINEDCVNTVGVVTETLDHGYMIAWFGEKGHHYASPYQLESAE